MYTFIPEVLEWHGHGIKMELGVRRVGHSNSEISSDLWQVAQSPKACFLICEMRTIIPQGVVG